MAKAKKETVAKKTKEREKKTSSKKKEEVKKTQDEVKGKKKEKKAARAVKESDLIAKSKQEIIEEYALKKGDTGSPEVQIALSTQKIYNLQKHLEQNPKDNHSRRGLLKIIAKRRRILHYLQEKDDARYKGLIKNLGLKK